MQMNQIIQNRFIDKFDSLSYRIVERNAKLLQGGYGNVCTPCCWIAGAAEKDLNMFAAGILLLLGVVNTAKRFCTAQLGTVVIRFLLITVAVVTAVVMRC